MSQNTPEVDSALAADVKTALQPALVDMFAVVILNAAANGIRTCGWLVGDYGTAGGPKDLTGALQEATFGRVGDWAKQGSDADLMYLRAHKALHDELGGVMPVADWNDTRCRDRDHAAQVLRDAAAGLAASLSPARVA